MKLSTLVFSSLLCVCSLALSGQEFQNKAGSKFPNKVSFESSGKTYSLQATGAATRKKLIVNVYSIAHYIQEGVAKPAGDNYQNFFNDETAKQFTIKWLHKVGPDKIREAYAEAFQKNLNTKQMAQLKPALDQWYALLGNEAKVGDEYVYRWVPGGIIEVLINGKSSGRITNNEFAKALWAVWFGPHSVVDRNQLISLMK